MDRRSSLNKNDRLAFPGLECVIDAAAGRGSGVLAYTGYYPDREDPRIRHRVLIRKLSPYDPPGGTCPDRCGTAGCGIPSVKGFPGSAAVHSSQRIPGSPYLWPFYDCLTGSSAAGKAAQSCPSASNFLRRSRIWRSSFRTPRSEKERSTMSAASCISERAFATVAATPASWKAVRSFRLSPK